MSEDTTAAALGRIFKYLEDRYANDRATLRDIDSKVKLRLTVISAVGGLVALGLKELEASSLPHGILLAVLVAVGAYAVTYAVTVLRALGVLKGPVALPGVDPDTFIAASRAETLGESTVLRELIECYVRAIADGQRHRAEREHVERAFQSWLTAATVSAFIAIGALGYAYVLTSIEANAVQTGVERMAEDKKAEQPAPNEKAKVQADTQKGESERPSLATAPERVELGGNAGEGVVKGPPMPVKIEPEKKSEGSGKGSEKKD